MALKKLKFTLLLLNFLSNRLDTMRYSNKAEEFAKQMETVINQIKDNLVRAQHHQEIQHNQSRSMETFKKGDWILLHIDTYGNDG